MTNLLETFIMKDKSSVETDIETNYGKKRVSTNQKKYPARIWTKENKTFSLLIVIVYFYIFGRTKWDQNMVQKLHAGWNIF